MSIGPIKVIPRGSESIDYTTLRRVVEYVRNSGTFDPRFFRWLGAGGQNLVSLNLDSLREAVALYEGPFAGTITGPQKLRIRDGYWTLNSNTKHFSVSGGSVEENGILYHTLDFTGASKGLYYVYLQLDSASTSIAYSLQKSTTRPVEYEVSNVLKRVLGTVSVVKTPDIDVPDDGPLELFDWWQEQFGNVFVGGGGGSGLTAVEVRWYAPDFTGNPPKSGVDYLVDNTILNQEGPTVTGFALERGRFWHTVPELDGSTMIHHKFQKCFRG